MCEGDVKKAVDHVFQNDSSVTSFTEARRIAMSRYRKEGIIRTYGPQPAQLRSNWEALIERFKNDRSVQGKHSIIRRLP